MQKIIFICHGNICRSPMAEFIFKNMVAKRGLSDRFEVASAATSTDERGRDIYPPAQKVLTENGIPFESRHARQITKADGEHYDLLICMDHNNLKNARRILPEEAHHKLRLFMEFAGESRDVADPWYTRNFQKAFDDIFLGCQALLSHLTKEV